MTKQEAVYRVAEHIAGLLQAGTLEEATADAVDVVAARLYRMGTAPRESG